MISRQRTSSKLWSSSVACAVADTQYTTNLPKGASQVQIRSGDTAGTWRWSMHPGVVAGGGGMPMLAGEVQSFDMTAAPLEETQAIYFAVDATATMQLSGASVGP